MAKAKTSKPAPMPIGTNIVMTPSDFSDEVSLVIDLTADFWPTSTGKNRRVATTSGNTGILAGLKLGINCYDPIVGRGALAVSDIADQPKTPLGTNLSIEVEDGVAAITFDAGQDFGPTTSGKGRRVALTGGNVTIAGGLKLGLNCYDPVPAPRD